MKSKSIGILFAISIIYIQSCKSSSQKDEVDCNKVKCSSGLCIENIKNISKKFNADNVDDPYYIYLIDQSGSMSGSFGSSDRMTVAKQLTIDFVNKINIESDTGKNFGLYTFGGYGCNCIQEIQSPFVEFNKKELIQRIEKITPTGATPISNSLEIMQALLENKKGNYSVTLITDGMESCGGKPEVSAKNLQSLSNILASQITIDIVIAGIEMNEQEDAALNSIAKAGNGKYIPVKSEANLKRAFVFSTPFYYGLSTSEFTGYINSTKNASWRCMDTDIPGEILVSCEKSQIRISQSTRKEKDVYHFYLLRSSSSASRKASYRFFKENNKPRLRAAFEVMKDKLKDENLEMEEKTLIEEALQSLGN
jgi:von Willebrand factor type A domain